MTNLYNGRLIAIEGLDGSGKTSVAHALEKKLTNNNYSVVLTKEPGGTELGAMLREILHTKKQNVCDTAEFLLFAADRAQHFQQLVIPALKAGKIVIADRLADSSLAYQGYGRGLDRSMIQSINQWAMQQVTPDVTLYLRIDPTTALNRVRRRQEALTSFEQEARDFWMRVVDGYEKIFVGRKNLVVVDALLPLQELAEQAAQQVLTMLAVARHD